MQAFSQELTSDSYGTCLFHFQRLYTANNFVYYVSTDSDATGGHAFTMTPRPSGGWRLINAPKVPDWIERMESELSAAILQHNQE